MSIHRSSTGTTAALALAALAVGCADPPTTAPARPVGRPAAALAAQPVVAAKNEPPAPAPLATATVGGAVVTYWPYTSEQLDAELNDSADPVNALFAGAADHADPLRIRAALRRLNGDRTAFGYPAAFPFNCTWKDAIGDEMTAYGVDEGWTSAAVQLACGGTVAGFPPWYGPLRFHLRLFQQGAATLANAHMDLNLPNSHVHQVISWEVAEQLVAVDMIRSGLLAGPPQLGDPVTHAATYRQIPVEIWKGMSNDLRQLVGVTDPGNLSIPDDGRARLFVLAKGEPIVPDEVTHEFTIQFNTGLPNQICPAQNQFLFLQGPLHFVGHAWVTGGGTYHREHQTAGALTAVPVNRQTGQPIGAPMRVLIGDQHVAGITPGGVLSQGHLVQQLFDAAGVLRASSDERLAAGTRGHDDWTRTVFCAP